MEAKNTWKKQVDKESMIFGLNKAYALCLSKWIVGVNRMATRFRQIQPPFNFGDTSDLQTLVSLSLLE